MQFRFIGKYTGGNESISVGGVRGLGAVLFSGREPAEVEDAALAARLSGHPEFEAVEDASDRSMTKAEIKAALDKAGVEYPALANKGELQKLLDGAEE